MKIKYRLRITQGLFYVSIIVSCFSYINATNGNTEIYPFFYWKLYTQPLGNNYIYNDYRIYGINTESDTIRIANKGYKNFNQDDYYYFLHGEAQLKLNKPKLLKLHKKRLKDFGKFIAPNFTEYLLVKEIFNPLDLTKDPQNYQREIITSTK